MWVNEETSKGVLLGAVVCGGAATGEGPALPAAARAPSMERRMVEVGDGEGEGFFFFWRGTGKWKGLDDPS